MLELVFCIAGIYVCFLTWGILQERVSTTPYYPQGHRHLDESSPQLFTHFVFLNCIQALLAASVAYFYARWYKNLTFKQPTASLIGQYTLVAFFSTIASPFGYESLKHVDYPTMILAKSCKLLPVILMGILLHNRRFEWYKYLSVLLITTGVATFALTHNHSSSTSSNSSASSSSTRSNSFWGLFLLAINLLIDGITNSTQDNIFLKHRISGPEMMFYMNFLSFILMAGYLAVVSPLFNPDFSSDLISALAFLSKYPTSIYDILLFGLCGSIGQVFIFYTLQRFGSLVLVTVNVTRKMISMLLSVVWFGHLLTFWQWGGVGLVFFGILLEAQMSRIQKISTKSNDKLAVVEEESVEIKPKRKPANLRKRL